MTVGQSIVWEAQDWSSKNGRMEQSKAMEYEGRKASSDVLKPRKIYIHIYIYIYIYIERERERERERLWNLLNIWVAF